MAEKSVKKQVKDAEKKAKGSGVMPHMGFAEEMLKMKSPAEKLLEKQKKKKKQ